MNKHIFGFILITLLNIGVFYAIKNMKKDQVKHFDLIENGIKSQATIEDKWSFKSPSKHIIRRIKISFIHNGQLRNEVLTIPEHAIQDFTKLEIKQSIPIYLGDNNQFTLETLTRNDSPWIEVFEQIFKVLMVLYFITILSTIYELKKNRNHTEPTDRTDDHATHGHQSDP